MLYYVLAWYLIGVLCWLIFDALDGKITLFNVVHAIFFGPFGVLLILIYAIYIFLLCMKFLVDDLREIILWKRKND